ncbi:DEAD/DEAH box helicase [Acetobacteraceae bacterium H6797]|nr:DEAD/DEAH box helicase [Acetobacteraceae bacterium H6797]
MTDFASLGLAEPILRAVASEGYTTPTPIQAQTIPYLLEGRDVLGIAQTGTGKTASFMLPILHRFNEDKQRPVARGCRALVLAPTRELAAQIADNARAYGRYVGVSVAVVVGGVGHQPQIKAMSRGVDVLVATPGRLLDHVGTGAIRLDMTEVVVLDEADHMLDLGFLVPIRRILSHMVNRRQNVFFSATMPNQIGQLAEEMLSKPAKVSVTPVATTAEKVRQAVVLIEAERKRDLLVELLADPSFARTLVFTRTKHGADKVVKFLEAASINAAAIHGNKSQGARERALGGFRDGEVRVLVATDIAARGIDVEGVTHVINYELPDVPEAYVHRIGRTARAGATGMAIAFCDTSERGLLRDIEKTTRQSIPQVDRRLPGASDEETIHVSKLPRQGRGQRPGGGGGHRHGGQGQRAQGQQQRSHGGGGGGGGGNRQPQGQRPQRQRSQGGGGGGQQSSRRRDGGR